MTGIPAEAVAVPVGNTVMLGSDIVGMVIDILGVGYGCDWPGVVELQFNTSVTIGLTPGTLGQYGKTLPLMSSGLKSMGPPTL